MNTPDLSQAKPLNNYLPADKAQQLVELIATVRDNGAGEAVEIRDEFGRLGFFVPAEVYAGMPPLGTPEFDTEGRRRMASKEPVIPAEEVIAWLESQSSVKPD